MKQSAMWSVALAGVVTSASGATDAARPDRVAGTYTVPGPEELVDVSAFPIKAVRLTASPRGVRLSYDLPKTLVGVRTAVELSGTASADGEMELSGEAGTASCTTSEGGVVCGEVLDGVTVDLAAVRAVWESRGATGLELDRHLAVAERFAHEPIGILHFPSVKRRGR